ncbi:MAG: hypothetical protein D6738_13495, partial [Acidobacteria bacterium]
MRRPFTIIGGASTAVRSGRAVVLGIVATLSCLGVLGAADAPPAQDERLAWRLVVEAERARWRGGPAPDAATVRSLLAREDAWERILAARGRGVTGPDLDEEWRAIRAGTRMRARLARLEALLRFDRRAMLETLARPRLVHRRVRALWRSDRARWEAAVGELEILRARILESGDPGTLAGGTLVAYLPAWQRDVPVPAEPEAQITIRVESAAEWSRLSARWAGPGGVGPIWRSDQFAAFEVERVRKPTGAVLALRFSRPALGFEAWAARALAQAEAGTLPAPVHAAAGSPATGSGTATAGPTEGTCDEAWRPGTLGTLPDPREGATAVWTGSEMIVWGGRAGASFDNGGRYDPVLDSWRAITEAGAPSPRSWHTAVWTGTEMIVWGGADGDPFGDGAAYDPVTDAWRPLALAGAPSARSRHTAVWTGSEMIVWGGENDLFEEVRDGGRYDPVADAWSPLPSAGAPSARKDHTAVWTGSEMIVWGGRRLGTPLGDGGRFDPASGTWSPLPAASAPSPRWFHRAVWTGTEMVVWGGTGSGGYLGDGARFDPVADTWTPLPGAGAPSPRRLHSAVWTGTEMIVWGGEIDGGGVTATGGAWSAASDAWRSLPTAGAPAGRRDHGAVWSGTEMIVWGGGSPDGERDDGGRYDPVLDSWAPSSTGDGPGPRERPTAVWTGAEMIVWGGLETAELGDGGAYDPVLDDWRPLAATGAPS